MLPDVVGGHGALALAGEYVEGGEERAAGEDVGADGDVKADEEADARPRPHAQRVARGGARVQLEGDAGELRVQPVRAGARERPLEAREPRGLGRAQRVRRQQHERALLHEQEARLVAEAREARRGAASAGAACRSSRTPSALRGGAGSVNTGASAAHERAVGVAAHAAADSSASMARGARVVGRGYGNP